MKRIAILCHLVRLFDWADRRVSAQFPAGARLQVQAPYHGRRLAEHQPQAKEPLGHPPGATPQTRANRPSRRTSPCGEAAVSSLFFLKQVAQDMCLLDKLFELIGELFPLLRVTPLRLVLKLCDLLDDECPQLLNLQLQFLW